MSNQHRPALAALALVLLLCAALTAACGKKGNPTPDYSEQLFSWRHVNATVSGPGCLSVSGAVGGSAANVAGMTLELQPYDDSCAGCPFVAQESHTVSPADVMRNDGAFSFAYCPASRADAYRWRLVGRNTRPGLPAVLTPARVASGLLQPAPQP